MQKKKYQHLNHIKQHKHCRLLMHGVLISLQFKYFVPEFNSVRQKNLYQFVCKSLNSVFHIMNTVQFQVMTSLRYFNLFILYNIHSLTEKNHMPVI